MNEGSYRAEVRVLIWDGGEEEKVTKTWRLDYI